MRKYKFEKKNLYKSADFNRNDEKYWKFGMLYCNPDDPLMFVRGRGRGLVPNYGHKVIKILIVTGVLFIMAFVVIFELCVKALL